MISDWDCLAIDEMNNSTNGVFVSPTKVRVVVNKNELISEHEGQQWTIKSGNMTLGDTQIICDIGPKNGIYFVVYSEPFRAMIGIGSKGYLGNEGYVGVENEDVEWLKEIMSIWGDSIPPSVYDKLKMIDLSSALRHNQGDAQISHEFKAQIPATKPGDARAPLLASALKIAHREEAS